MKTNILVQMDLDIVNRVLKFEGRFWSQVFCFRGKNCEGRNVAHWTSSNPGVLLLAM